MSDQTVTITADEEGNFTSPALQSLLEVWEDFENEQVGTDEVLSVMQKIRAFVDAQIHEMEKGADSPDVDVHDPNRVAILNGFNEHLSALDKMSTFFETDEIELVEEAFEQLQFATNQMVMGFQGLMEHEEEFAPKLCLHCSTENERQATQCKKCGAMMPIIEAPNEKRLLGVAEDESETSDEALTTPNYMEVAEAHEAWESEASTAEEFYQVIDTVRQRNLAQFDEAVKLFEEAQQSEDEQVEEYLDYLERTSQVLGSNVESLETMLLGLEQGKVEVVEDGLTAFAEATIALIEVQKVGERFSASEDEGSRE